MLNIIKAWIYILAMFNLIVWAGVYGNINHGLAQYRPNNINMTRDVFPVKAQWI